jgi:hypothetical protein
MVELGRWNLKRYREKGTKGLCPTSSENAKHVILGSNKTAEWRMILRSNKWLKYRKN